MKENRTIAPSEARDLIYELREMGVKQSELAKELGISRQCVTAWIKYGMPRPWLMYLRLAYPSLDYWRQNEQ